MFNEYWILFLVLIATVMQVIQIFINLTLIGKKQ